MLVVTGTSTPNVAGTYAVSGSNDGQANYTRTTSTPKVLWWYPPSSAWYLSDGVGAFTLDGAEGGFYKLALPLNNGAMTPFGGASGSATLALIAPLIGDTFTAGADTALTAWGATGTDGGYNYSVTVGSATVLAASDVCQWTTATSSVMEARAETDLTSPDMAVQFTLADTPAVSGNSFEAIARFAAAARSYYGLRYRWGTNDLRLFKRLNGSTNTQIGSTVTGLTPAAGQVLRLEVRTTTPGTTELRGYIDGVLRVGPVTDTEASIQSTTRAGFAFVGTRTAIGIDNFSAAVLAPAFLPAWAARRGQLIGAA
jgi:hypothetical protein